MTGKRIVTAWVFLVLLASAASASAAASFSGTWAIAGGLPWTCTLTQKDNLLTGECKGSVLQGPASGGVNGNHVNWTWDAKANPDGPQGSAMIAFTGQWDFKNAVTGGQWIAQKSTGAISVQPDPKAFTATRQTTQAN